jgi:hypothetical protein
MEVGASFGSPLSFILGLISNGTGSNLIGLGLSSREAGELSLRWRRPSLLSSMGLIDMSRGYMVISLFPIISVSGVSASEIIEAFSETSAYSETETSESVDSSCGLLCL